MDINIRAILLIAFNLTIFTLLSIQLAQLIRLYLLPALRNKIASLKKFWKSLQEQLDLMGKTKKRLETNIKDQKKRLQNLEKSMQAWHSARIEKQQEQERAYTERAQILYEKKRKQYEHSRAVAAERELLPEVIADTKKTLQKQLGGPEGKKILSNVITTLAKK